MNHYNYDEIEVGMKKEFQAVITDEMLEKFRTITGDENPLHTDSEFAAGKGYSKQVCYGMLTASFLSTLAGVYLPGEKSLIHSVEIKMTKPVFSGDQLTISGEVTEKNDLFSVFIMKITILNQNKEKVLRGKMQVGVI